jgi:outer membrane protein assembly factor BamD (BamD/ComL family)
VSLHNTIQRFRETLAVKCNVLIVLVLTLAVVSRADAEVGRHSSQDLFDEAKALSTHEDWGNAITRFREFLRQHSDDARASEARFWIGYCLVKSDEFDEAVLELAPFETTLAQDKWADDALLQLGHAYRGDHQNDRALAAWKRLQEKYPDSVWRTEAALQSIDVLYTIKDYAACLPYCERVVQQAADFAGITEARYVGAYCLGALSRYDEADRWMDRWFSADNAVEAGWRQVLTAQRELRQGHVNQAFAAIEALDADFPDLDRDDRLDLTLRAATMLTRENQPGRARELVVAALKQSAGHSEENIDALLDQLAETASGDDSFLVILNRLAGDTSLSLMARVVVRDRHVRSLREGERSDQAELLLREALTNERGEYARFRAATLLAELLNEDRDDRAGAAKVLDDLLPSLRRNDLVHQVRETIKDLQPQPGDDRD